MKTLQKNCATHCTRLTSNPCPQAIANKRLDKPLTPEQVRDLLHSVDELKPSVP